MKNCLICKTLFTPKQKHQKYCSIPCRETYHRDKERASQYSRTMPRASVGAMSELLVCSDLLSKGYEVFRNVSPFGTCDLVSIKDGVIKRLEVKTGHIRNGKLNHCHIYHPEFVDILAIVIPPGNIIYKILEKTP